MASGECRLSRHIFTSTKGYTEEKFSPQFAGSPSHRSHDTEANYEDKNDFRIVRHPPSLQIGTQKTRETNVLACDCAMA